MRGLWLGYVLALIACADGRSSSDASIADAAGTAGDAAPAADSAFEGCAEATYQAEQRPTALLVVLDRSQSMGQANKYAFAAQAIVQALDQDVFDAVAVGLYAAPSAEVAGPECLFNLPVACQVPPFPVVDLAVAGAEKSSAAAGVRRSIKDWLNAHSTVGMYGDASPLYGALEVAIASLQAWPEDGNRILMVVTDGSISCNELSVPARPGYQDCNGCTRDWEDPSNLVQLLAAARADADEPIETFVVGVPGADTYDPTGCEYPPYRMRAALSAIAYAGSQHTPAACDGTSFTQAAPDPALSCHFDMTQGNFSIQQVADALSYVRGEVLGCVFDLPEPPVGMELDLGEINVEYTADGSVTQLGKRANPADTCDATGCWDYINSNTQLELFGRACTEVKTGASVQVRIITGCQTVVL
ncbi:MAG TPA: hypothetical protein VML75_09815 [Kofleriaceae bacterium]|nr:hypothetical protein [Kofleriaceae bacterium]